MAEDYDYTPISVEDYLFPEFPKETLSWYNFYLSLFNFLTLYDKIYYALCIIGIIINIFHCLILSRKSMRYMTISLFLLTIGVCDILQMTLMVFQLSDKFWTEYQESIISSECIPPPTYFKEVLTVFSSCLLINTLELSIYFSVTMAILRAVAIKFPLNQRISSLINSNHGKFIILGVFTLYSPFWLLGLFDVKVIEAFTWKAPSHCNNVPKNYTQVFYDYMPIKILGFKNNKFQQTIAFCEGAFSRLLPIIVLPIATCLLIWEMRKNRVRTRALTSLKNQDRTTLLVITMTVSFLVATTPNGILCATSLLTADSYGIDLINDLLSYIFGSLYVINGSIHFHICILMSGQYRDTVGH